MVVEDDLLKEFEFEDEKVVKKNEISDFDDFGADLGAFDIEKLEKVTDFD